MNIKRLLRINDMSTMNIRETRNLPYRKYFVVVHSNEHNPVHFHVISTEEKFEIECTLDGDLYRVKKYGSRSRKDKFSDILKLVKEWLNSDYNTKYGKQNNRLRIEQTWEEQNPEL